MKLFYERVKSCVNFFNSCIARCCINYYSRGLNRATITLAHSGPKGSDVFWHTVNGTGEDSTTHFWKACDILLHPKVCGTSDGTEGFTWPPNQGTIIVKYLVVGHKEPTKMCWSWTQYPEHQSRMPFNHSTTLPSNTIMVKSFWLSAIKQDLCNLRIIEVLFICNLTCLITLIHCAI